MKRFLVFLLLAAPLTLALFTRAYRAPRVETQETLEQQVQILRDEAAALTQQEKFTQASNKLEALQVLFTKEGRYQEALEASLQIEALSEKVSDRKSPWNYVRIAEAYLGLGDEESFFVWMEKAVNERGFSRLTYFQDSRLDAVKGHPRYKGLVDACAKLIGVGQKAKDFHVTLLDGSPFTLSDQVGQVVLIDFWDVRCVPCRKEMPNLKEIFKDFNTEGLDIIGISLDTDRKLLDDYVKEAGLRWKISCSLNGWKDSTAELYKICATPSTWLIDRQGIVRYCDVSGPELRRVVEELTRE